MDDYDDPKIIKFPNKGNYKSLIKNRKIKAAISFMDCAALCEAPKLDEIQADRMPVSIGSAIAGAMKTQSLTYVSSTNIPSQDNEGYDIKFGDLDATKCKKCTTLNYVSDHSPLCKKCSFDLNTEKINAENNQREIELENHKTYLIGSIGTCTKVLFTSRLKCVGIFIVWLMLMYMIHNGDPNYEHWYTFLHLTFFTLVFLGVYKYFHFDVKHFKKAIVENNEKLQLLGVDV